MRIGIGKRRRIQTLVIAVVFTLSGGAVFTQFALAHQTAEANQTTFSAADAVGQVTVDDGVIRFEVSEDGNRFVWSAQRESENVYRFGWDGEPIVPPDSWPNGPTPYVTQGFIYPAGTLSDSNGVLDDGSPEFPDQVLGQWVCYGWWIGDPLHNGNEASWITTHLFNFGNGFGEATLVSEGYSVNEIGVPMARAIVGGTGLFAFARGIQTETNLGFNNSNGLNVSYEVHIES